ncbi:endonuclease III [Kallipyga gabonensis]|uniref:endonuclease III n=1 Tax=Kallipyga gabonensis TaxID=1686287 RepID=UPI000938D615|nr:endonuclease III [Kallipyga gabonensis]
MHPMTREEAHEIAFGLKENYPGLQPFLMARNPFESLVATILSAQTTDRQVNKVTPALFAAYPDPLALSRADEEEVMDYIRSIGFFRTKARNIIRTSQKLVEEFGGKVPNTMEELMTLPGVGRKTANVVLANSFGQPSMPVDTHVFRVSNRLGLSRSENPEECEQDLRKLLEPEYWNYFHLSIIQHGRDICSARSPRCEICFLKDHCRFFASLESEGKSC